VTWSRLTLAGSTGLLLACTAKKPQPGAERETSLRESIVAQVGKAACTSGSVCRTIGLGVRPCGGPQQYLIYSTAATDSARLAREVARYNQAEDTRNRRKGLVSDCRALVRPQVSCISGQCAATIGIR
jgi:hypothetical protein